MLNNKLVRLGHNFQEAIQEIVSKQLAAPIVHHFPMRQTTLNDTIGWD